MIKEVGVNSEESVLVIELIAVNVPKVEMVGIGEKDAVIDNISLDETNTLGEAESDKMAEIV